MKKVVIIGSGIAGLAASVRLKVAGYDVHVFESNKIPGGKVTDFMLDGFRFDAGPSLFTMPQLVDELFTLAGRSKEDYFSYKKKDVICNYFYEDGTRFCAYADFNRYIEHAVDVFEVTPRELQQYFEKSKRKYSLTAGIFLQKSLHRISTYLNAETVKAVLFAGGLGLFNTLHEENATNFRDPKIVQLFDRYATYNGSNPYRTPGIMSMIPHLEQGIGTYLPEGGMVNISGSIYKLACDLGVVFHFGKYVEEIVVDRNIATGVVVEGETISADLVVSNMDVVPTYRKLLKKQKAPEKILTQERSSSALIFYWGMNRKFDELDLHNIFFSSDYASEFRTIFEEKTVADDITVYVNVTSKDIPTDAPEGCENWFVMVNVPGNVGQDWNELLRKTRIQVIEKLSRILKVNIGDHIIVEDVLTPEKIEQRTSSYQGSLYGAASNNRMAAFLRHPNFSGSIEHLYFCGGSVHPGGGIPLSLLSGKIVAEIISKR